MPIEAACAPLPTAKRQRGLNVGAASPGVGAAFVTRSRSMTASI